MIEIPELSDELEPIVDAVLYVLDDEPKSPSKLARKAKVSTYEAQRALRWMTQANYCISVGNGCWTNYRTRRFGEYNRKAS